MIRRQARSTLFPYTTLFRSKQRPEFFSKGIQYLCSLQLAVSHPDLFPVIDKWSTLHRQKQEGSNPGFFFLVPSPGNTVNVAEKIMVRQHIARPSLFREPRIPFGNTAIITVRVPRAEYQREIECEMNALLSSVQ